MADFRKWAYRIAEKYNKVGFSVKLALRLNPAYRRSGGRPTYVSEDLKEVRIKLPLKRSTKNYVGTMFGGSMFAATDPIYMFQLIYLLGDEYVVWDKSSNITFKKPGTSTLTCSFIITDQLLEEIKLQIEQEGKYIFDLPVTLVNDKEEVVCEVTKTIYAASKKYYKARKKELNQSSEAKP